MDELQEQGLIHSFEYNHELAWKTLKDFLLDRGATALYGSKDVIRAAFNAGLITGSQAWMAMITDRHLTSRTYNEDVTKKILAHITDEYYDEFQQLHKKLTELAEETLNG